MKVSWLLGICILSGTAWAGDPVLGTWRLNVNKSSYNPGPAPKSQVRRYEAVEGGIQVTIKTVTADGKSTSVQHPLNYDGQEHPITGSGQADAIALEKIDEYTSEAVLKHAAKIIGRNRRTVSPDGKTMTITYEGAGNGGRPIKNIAVYERQ
jgi:hypothetical protein